MGILYLKGLWNGVKKSLSREGRERKVPFRWEHLGNYLAIQWELILGAVIYVWEFSRRQMLKIKKMS